MMFSSFEASGQSHSDLKQCATFYYPNMYPQYGISMPCSIVNLLRTRFLKTKVIGQGHSYLKIVRYNQQHHNASKHEIC